MTNHKPQPIDAVFGRTGKAGRGCTPTPLRFIELDTGCYVPASHRLKPTGYFEAVISGQYKRMHRVLWEMKNGPIPPGYDLNHKCRVKCCCNTDHLELMCHTEHGKRSTMDQLGFDPDDRKDAAIWFRHDNVDLSRKETAEALGVSPRSVHTWAKSWPQRLKF